VGKLDFLHHGPWQKFCKFNFTCSDVFSGEVILKGASLRFLELIIDVESLTKTQGKVLGQGE
jgi:hypothetical protein